MKLCKYLVKIRFLVDVSQNNYVRCIIYKNVFRCSVCIVELEQNEFRFNTAARRINNKNILKNIRKPEDYKKRVFNYLFMFCVNGDFFIRNRVRFSYLILY